jgi:hypothetical protein
MIASATDCVHEVGGVTDIATVASNDHPALLVPFGNVPSYPP